MAQRLKVGDVARRTGLTVRTLHHYDALGLLRPSARSASGHRLYTAGDVARLQQIASLRQLGFSLEDVGRLIDAPGARADTVERHLAEVRRHLDQTAQLCRRLETLAERLHAGQEPPLDEVLATIKETRMYEAYFTKEQIAALKARGAQRGPTSAMHSVAPWQEVAGLLRVEFARHTPPDAPSVQALARRWRALVDELTGGDEGLRAGLVRLYRADPEIGTRTLGPAVDPALLRYIGQATASLDAR